MASDVNYFIEDSGHTYICSECPPAKQRYGGPVYGLRTITLKRCRAHERSHNAKDIEAFTSSAGRIDPLPKRYWRKPSKEKALASSFSGG